MKPERTGTGVLHTKGAQGEDHEYDYSWELAAHRDGVTNARKEMWCFFIVEDGDLFQFEIVDEGTYMRVQNVDRNGCERYSAKGIPEAFIRLAYDLFQVPIGSSKELFVKSQTHPELLVSAEKHSKDARSVWKRLVDWGEAYRDESEERFFYPLKRQRVTTEVLTEMDQETTAPGQKRGSSNAPKLGVAQELLTGRTRLV